MKRVFICGEMNIPHNSPGANYTQHLAMAFRELGYEVILISNVVASSEKELTYLFENNIQIREFTVIKRKFVRGIDYKYFLPFKIQMLLRREKTKKDDLIIAYARREDVLKVILEEGRKTGAKTAACIVEWYGREDVDSENEFAKSEHLMNNVYPQFDLIIPISRYIENFFKKKKCRTVYIPCMSDANEYPPREKQYSGKKKIVYPANGKMKDALSEMLEAIISLPVETKKHCEFHFCGIKNEVADALTQNRIRPLVQQKTVIFHKWMSYEELIALYNEMHFLLLMRNKSRMTLANFPSKVPETMMQAVTPVCSDVGEYTKNYLHNGEDAIIVQDASGETIKNVIQMIADMKWTDVKRFNVNSRMTALQSFDYHCWLKVLRSAMEIEMQ